jgi:DNA segregation ATPase FtsK/SpoIIIE, S-DNA-T family
VGYLDQRTPIAKISAGPQPAPRDLLKDLITVLGEERMPAADVPALLRDLAPDHAPYRGLTGVKLREILEREYGIKVASTGNRYRVDPYKIRACTARRADDDPG